MMFGWSLFRFYFSTTNPSIACGFVKFGLKYLNISVKCRGEWKNKSVEKRINANGGRGQRKWGYHFFRVTYLKSGPCADRASKMKIHRFPGKAPSNSLSSGTPAALTNRGNRPLPAARARILP